MQAVWNSTCKLSQTLLPKGEIHDRSFASPLPGRTGRFAKKDRVFVDHGTGAYVRGSKANPYHGHIVEVLDDETRGYMVKEENLPGAKPKFVPGWAVKLTNAFYPSIQTVGRRGGRSVKDLTPFQKTILAKQAAGSEIVEMKREITKLTNKLKGANGKLKEAAADKKSLELQLKKLKKKVVDLENKLRSTTLELKFVKENARMNEATAKKIATRQQRHVVSLHVKAARGNSAKDRYRTQVANLAKRLKKNRQENKKKKMVKDNLVRKLKGKEAAVAKMKEWATKKIERCESFAAVVTESADNKEKKGKGGAYKQTFEDHACTLLACGQSAAACRSQLEADADYFLTPEARKLFKVPALDWWNRMREYVGLVTWVLAWMQIAAGDLPAPPPLPGKEYSISPLPLPPHLTPLS